MSWFSSPSNHSLALSTTWGLSCKTWRHHEIAINRHWESVYLDYHNYKRRGCQTMGSEWQFKGCAAWISPVWNRGRSGNAYLQWAEVWSGEDVKLLMLWNPAKGTSINDWVQPPQSLCNLSVSISTLHHSSLSHFHLSPGLLPQPHNWSTHFTLLPSNSCLTPAYNSSIASHHFR